MTIEPSLKNNSEAAIVQTHSYIDVVGAWFMNTQSLNQ